MMNTDVVRMSGLVAVRICWVVAIASEKWHLLGKVVGMMLRNNNPDAEELPLLVLETAIAAIVIETMTFSVYGK
jgi:hypothetical protein